MFPLIFISKVFLKCVWMTSTSLPLQKQKHICFEFIVKLSLLYFNLCDLCSDRESFFLSHEFTSFLIFIPKEKKNCLSTLIFYSSVTFSKHKMNRNVSLNFITICVIRIQNGKYLQYFNHFVKFIFLKAFLRDERYMYNFIK